MKVLSKEEREARNKKFQVILDEEKVEKTTGLH